MMQRNRGRELLGTFNPLIVGELFTAQCQPWKDLAQRYVNLILAAARDLLHKAMEHVADEVTGERLLRHVIEPSMTRLKGSVQVKLEELLAPHLSGHPITYNHYLTENIQKAQVDRHERKLREVFQGYFNLEDNKSYTVHKPMHLLKSVMAATEPNMDDYASMTAVDTMEAYYKVATKKFTDDVSVLAIEQCIIDKLSSIFSSDVICDMTDDDINELAGEGPETVAQRKYLTEKLKVLEEGMEKLKKLGRLSNGRPEREVVRERAFVGR